jgi:hypothetical protein
LITQLRDRNYEEAQKVAELIKAQDPTNPILKKCEELLPLAAEWKKEESSESEEEDDEDEEEEEGEEGKEEDGGEKSTSDKEAGSGSASEEKEEDEEGSAEEISEKEEKEEEDEDETVAEKSEPMITAAPVEAVSKSNTKAQTGTDPFAGKQYPVHKAHHH